jgi:hypothetical protein
VTRRLKSARLAENWSRQWLVGHGVPPFGTQAQRHLAVDHQNLEVKRLSEGGSWHVQVSLAQTGHWLRGLGRIDGGLTATAPDASGWLTEEDSGFGRLAAVRPSAQLARTPAGYARPAMPPGADAARW